MSARTGGRHGRRAKAEFRPLDWGNHRTGTEPQLVALEEREDFKLELCNKVASGRRRKYRHALNDLLDSGFVGVGFGVKISERKREVTAARCVRVYVRKKLRNVDLRRELIVPTEINGLPTDVIALPNLRTEAVPCGSIVGYRAGTAGTISCLVERGGQRFVLSNNHVLANSNSAHIGDPISVPALEPGPFATLAAFQPLDFTYGARNDMDAAIAEILTPASVDARINLLGRLSPQIATAYPSMPVQKSGIGSDVTHGSIEAYGEDISFPYGDKIARFREQLAVRGATQAFSNRGDSGSLVVTEGDRRPVGLLFGSAPLKGLSFCTRIAPVLDHFGVSLVTG